MTGRAGFPSPQAGPVRWKTRLKRIAFRLFYHSGLELLVARSIKVNAAAMIMYHGVCDNSRLPPEVDFHLSAATFEQHLRMLKRRYPIIPCANCSNGSSGAIHSEKRSS